MAKGKTKEPKAPKKPKPPKKGKPPKKPPKGQEVPQEGEELEGGKKKKPIVLILIIAVVVVIAAVAVVLFVFVLPGGDDEGADDPEVIETEEPLPPELPEELMVGDVSVPGMTLEADESKAQAVPAKTVTYTYINLNDAGAAAKTYMDQLTSASPRFYLVDEEFVRLTEDPDFTTPEGTVLLARDLPKPAPEVVETPAPTDPPEDEGGEDEDGESEDSATVTEGLMTVVRNLLNPGSEVEGTPTPTDPPEDGSGAPEGSDPAETAAPEEPVEKVPDLVIAVEISWSEGRCVVVADEKEGKVTSPPANAPGMTPSIGIRDAEAQLLSMTPAELGLPGTSMATEYEVFWEDGTELVNDVTCIRLNVYNSSDGPNPYMFASGYLMSVDGAHLYKLDPITNEISELEFTLNVG